MVHCLAVRKGSVSILCNGRPAINTKGAPTNRFKGDPVVLLDAIKETSENGKRVLIPQKMLHHRVNCEKCSTLMDPKTADKYMKKIYFKSSKWKTRRAERKVRQNRISHLEAKESCVTSGCHSNTSQQVFKIPPEKTCVLTISFV